MAVDPCFAALLADPRNTVRPPPDHVPMEKVRAVANAAMRGAARRPVGSARDLAIPADGRRIPARLYRPDADAAAPVVVFVHGGGWVWGDLDTHDALCRELTRRIGCAVLAVDYRLAPETPYPGALQDVVAALDWIAAEGAALGVDPDRVALFGDSAGANLATAAALVMRDRGRRLRHLALAYPVVDPACDSASQAEFTEGPLLTRDAMLWFWRSYLGAAPAKPRDRYALLEADLGGLPPTSVATAAHDVLREEGEALAARLKATGVPVVLRRFEGMIHGFLSLPIAAPSIDRALEEITGDLRAALAPPGEETAR